MYPDQEQNNGKQKKKSKKTRRTYGEHWRNTGNKPRNIEENRTETNPENIPEKRVKSPLLNIIDNPDKLGGKSNFIPDI